MLKNINNDNGAALIMVLIMLVVVAGLAGGLLAATTFNTRFSGDEIERNLALQAADSGVEFVNSWLNSNNSKDILNKDKLDQKEFGENDYYLIYDDNNEIIFNNEEKPFNYSEDYSFSISVENIENNIITFVSEGSHNNYMTRKIKFSHRLMYDSGNEAGIILNENTDDDPEDHIDIRGNAGEFYINNFDLVDDEDSWADYSKRYFHDGYDWDDLYFSSFTGNENINIDKNTFASKNLEIVSKYDTDEDYSEGDKVKGSDGNWYKAIEDVSDEDPVETNGYWEQLESDDGSLRLTGGFGVEKSIFAIDGNLYSSGGGGTLTFKDSLVVVKGEVDIGGNVALDNSMIIAFNEIDKDGKGPNDKPVTIRGSIDEMNPIRVFEEFYDNLDYDEIARDFLKEYEKLLETRGDGSLDSVQFNRDWREIN